MNRPTSLLMALVAAWATNPLIMLLHTAFEYAFPVVTLAAPLTEYLLSGYFPLVVAGVIIAHSDSTHRIFDASFVGIVYAATKSIAWALARGDASGDPIGSLFPPAVNFTLLSMLLVVGACTLTRQIRKTQNQVP